MPNMSFSEELISIDEFLKRKRQNDKLTHWVKTTPDDELYHYGMPRRSGRYKWGSGDRPFQGDEVSITALRKKAQKRIDANRGKSQDDLKRERKEAHDREVDDAYEYFRSKRQEKADKERPMSALLRDANERAKSINTNKVLREAEEKARKRELDDDDLKSAQDDAKRLRSNVESDYSDDSFVKINNSDGSKPKKTVYVDKNGNEHTVYDNRYVNGTRSDNTDNTNHGSTTSSSDNKDQRSKSSNSDDKPSSRAKDATESERDTPSLYATRKASDMTTKELQDFNVRRKLADKYNEYYEKDNPSKLSILSDITKSGSNITKDIKRGVDDYYTQKHKEEKARIDLSGVSDNDLKKVVSRMQLEKQYRDLAPDIISDGESKTKKILGALDTALASSSTILSTADIIRKAFGY